ncbi:hypothetical protein K438DRAFT_1962984 [Mycena galopus ATCC 62051]|nr:hypothetical protein K438DRAFT_1962984 [Mycena galopus ATCC 62051]
MSVLDVVHLAPKIAEIFGAKKGDTAVQTIGNLVQTFDFSKVDVSTKTRDDCLHTGLAPSFGNLTRESIKAMDEQLKIMIAGTNRELEQTPAEERTWDKIIAIFMQNPLIEPVDTPTANIVRADKLIKKDSNWFKVDRHKDDGVAREVLSWFTTLISDEDVLNSTKIDIKVFADIVATTGAAIDSFLSFFSKTEHHEKTVVDIGVLRYPDIDHPYFKVYRIKISAWSDTTRITFHAEDANGITGEYNVRLFKPRDSVISGMKAETKKKASEEADAMFA